MQSGRTRTEYTYLALCILTAGFYFLAIHLYHTGLPLWDDFDAVLNFLNYYSIGSWSERVDLITSLHNEHRIIISKIIYASTWHTFGSINFKDLEYFAVLSWLGVAALILSQLKSWPIRLISCFFLFSLRQNELLMLTMAAMQQYQQILFSLLFLYFYTKAEDQLKNTLISAIFLLLSCLSGGGWIALAPPIIFKFLKNRKIQSMDIAISGLFLFCLSLYFVIWPYHTPVKPPIIPEVLSKPWQAPLYILAFAGSAMDATQLAILLGAFLLFLSFKLWVSERPSFLSLSLLFIFSTAALSSIARFEYGIDQAISSKYSIFSIVAICMLLIRFEPNLLTNKTKLRSLTIISFVAYAIISLKGASNLRTNRDEFLSGAIRHPDVESARSVLQKSKELGIFEYNIPAAK